VLSKGAVAITPASGAKYVNVVMVITMSTINEMINRRLLCLEVFQLKPIARINNKMVNGLKVTQNFMGLNPKGPCSIDRDFGGALVMTGVTLRCS
jgi:hypothetical protein